MASLDIRPTERFGYEAKGAVTVPIAEGLGLRVGAFAEKVGGDYSYENGDPLGEEETYAVTGTLNYDAQENFRLKATGYYVSSEDTRQLVSQAFTTPAGECDLVYNGELRALSDGSITGTFSTDLSQSALGTFCGNIPDWDESGYDAPPAGLFDSPDFVQQPARNSPDFFEQEFLDFAGKGLPSVPDGFGTTYKTWRANVSGEWDIAAGHTLSAMLSRGTASSIAIYDNNFGQSNVGTASAGRVNWSKDDYAELALQSSQDQRLRYKIGLSYSDNTNFFTNVSAFANFPFVTTPFEELVSENIAVFGSVDYDITEEITISAEGRYADETFEVLYDGAYNVDRTDPNAVRDRSTGYEKFMPRVIVSYQPTEDLNVYANWAISYLAGFETNVTNYVNDVPTSGIDPDEFGIFTPTQKLTSYEIGVKSRLTETITGSLSAYYMEWDNQVLFELSPFPIFTPLYSPGDSEYIGIEGELSATPTEWLNLTGNFSFTDVEFTSFGGTGSVATAILNPNLPPATQISANGNRPRFIPEWTAAVSATVALDTLFDLPVPAYMRVDAPYTGQFFIDNFEYNSVEGYWKVNLRAGVDITEDLNLEVYGKNLTDNRSWLTAGGTTTATLGPPGRKTFGTLPARREFGLQATYSF